ncbi:MAG: hypothetical protein KA974_01300 [Saprospiraceae bacterium]|nr:hypothetical protein [Saprospiraceae bacterium]
MGNQTQKIAFNVATMMATPYRTDVIQDKYFVAQTYEQLYESLPQIKQTLAQLIM